MSTEAQWLRAQRTVGGQLASLAPSPACQRCGGPKVCQLLATRTAVRMPLQAPSKASVRFGSERRSEMAMALIPATIQPPRRLTVCSQFDVRAGVRETPSLSILIDYRK